ncbi:MAG: hypothetical protein ACI4MJ_02790 [Aristaeellaceae bacterium]
MKIITCHQRAQGHSATDGYAAPVLESRTAANPNAPRTYAFPLNDSRREISEDKQTYVLEIEPTDDSFQRTAAICSQWKTSGTPSKYTHWLVPVDETTSSTMLLLKRDAFMSGEELAHAYESSMPLTLRKVEVPDGPVHPQRQLTEQQQKTLGQFLALYWVSLAQNHPSRGMPGNRLPLMLRDGRDAALMKNEQAVVFFNQEIVSRLPAEAREMVSAVFGIKWSEAVTSFKKAVCVILSTETGVPTDKKIDLLNSSHDLLSKLNHRDREALNAIGRCLMAGEANYPEWYTAFRALKNGIPKAAAPQIMYLGYLIQAMGHREMKLSDQVTLLENCYVGLYTHTCEGGAGEDEVRAILEPLAQRISSLWTQLASPTTETYFAKRKWAMALAHMPQPLAIEHLSPLVTVLLQQLLVSSKLSDREKTRAVVHLLHAHREPADADNIRRMERYLSSHFEDYLELCLEPSPDEERQELLETDSFERIVRQWKPDKPRHDADTLITLVQQVLALYPELPRETAEALMLSLNQLWLTTRVNTLRQNEKRGEQPTLTDLKALGEGIGKLGLSEAANAAAEDALSYLKEHYLLWIEAEPAIIAGDQRFLTLAQKWMEENLLAVTEDCSVAGMEVLEAHLLKVFDAYGESSENRNRCLARFRRIKGKAQLDEILAQPDTDMVQRAFLIADLHVKLRETEGVLTEETGEGSQEGDELEKAFTNAMLPCFLAWSHCTPPFGSGSKGKYVDNWFLHVAREWQKNGLEDVQLDAQALDELRLGMTAAFKNYQSKEQKETPLLMHLRLLWGEAKLQETMDADIDPVDKAVTTADIHSQLRRFQDAMAREPRLQERFERLEKALRDYLSEHFLAWEKAEKPFMSGFKARYEDDWLMDVLGAWIKDGNELAEQSSAELEALVQNIAKAFKQYTTREQADMLTLPIWKQWGETRLQEVKQLPESSQAALQMAAIHNKLRQIPHALSKDIDAILSASMLDYFVLWGQAEKPFASGESLRYEDSWFEQVAREWISSRMVREGLTSKQLSALLGQLDAACRGHRIKDDDRKELLHQVKRTYAAAYVQEYRNDFSDADAASLIAEMLFRDEAVAEDEALCQSMIAHLAGAFMAWATASITFRTRVTGSKEYMPNHQQKFADILAMWQDQYLPHAMDADALAALRETIRRGATDFGMSGDAFDAAVVRLDYLLKASSFHDEQRLEVTAERLAKIAGQRMWITAHAAQLDSTSSLLKDMDDYLDEHMAIWLAGSRPLYVEQYGYTAEFVIPLVNQWLRDRLDSPDWTVSGVQELKRNLEAAQREIRRSMGKELLSADAQNKLVICTYNAHLHDICRKEQAAQLTGDDLATLAEIYVQAKDTMLDMQILSRMEDALIRNFGLWGLQAGFRLPYGARAYASQLDLVHLTTRWLEQPREEFTRHEELHRIGIRLRDAAIAEYQLDDETAARLQAMLEYKRSQALANALLRADTPSLDLVSGAFLCYAQQPMQQEADTRVKGMLKTGLAMHLAQWIDWPILIAAHDLEDVMQEWLSTVFPSIHFSSMAQISDLLMKVENRLKAASVPADVSSDMLCTMEQRWLHEAIHRASPPSTPISEIAAKGSRLRKSGKLPGGDALMLEQFLLAHFVAWSEEDFYARDGHALYGYEGFRELARKWLTAAPLREMSMNELEQLENRMENALMEGYHCSMQECRSILAPIAHYRKEYFLTQARQTMDEDALRQIYSMYREEPLDVYQQVLDIILNLIRKGKTDQQVIRFMESQAELWQTHDDEAFHAAVLAFFNKAFGLYEAGNRPSALTETMTAILEHLHYDLSAYQRDLQHWLQLRDQRIHQHIKAFLAQADSLQDLENAWQRQYGELLSISWEEISQRPAFAEGLEQRLQHEWDAQTGSAQRLRLIHGLSLFAASVTADAYRKQLFNILMKYLHRSFESWYAEPDNRPMLQEVLSLLQEQQIRIDAFTGSRIYQASIYGQRYNELLQAWDTDKALQLLAQRPEPLGQEHSQLHAPSASSSDAAWLLQRLLYDAPQHYGVAYWPVILEQLDLPLDRMDTLTLRELNEAHLIDKLFWCYAILMPNGIGWAAADLKECLRQDAPRLWNALHPLLPFGFSGIWRKIGGERIQADAAQVKAFTNWLLKGK